mmetsp:Transcript_98725/g.175741  ORF Transcript_98725/g.175741 Transcript_98725/m.175741 type:complete len:369 (-) Transcript_98725:50-1156(-)
MGEFDLEDCGIPAACCCCCCFILPLILLCCSFQGVSATDYGLLRNSVTGVVDLETTYHGVRGFVGFWKGYLIYPGTVLSLEWMDGSPMDGDSSRDMQPMEVRTADGLNVKLGIIVQYRVVEEFVAEIYKNYKQDYEAFFTSMLRSSIQSLLGGYQATDLYQKRAEIADRLWDACHKVCKTQLKGFLTCWGIQLRDIIFNDRIETVNINQQVEGQKQQTAEMHQKASFIRSQTKVQEAEFDKEIRLVTSRTEADAFNITRKAEADAEFRMKEARAAALYIMKNTVKQGKVAMDETQFVTFLERLAMLEAKDGPMIYGNFERSAVFMGGGANRKMSEKNASAPRAKAAEQALQEDGIEHGKSSDDMDHEL